MRNMLSIPRLWICFFAVATMLLLGLGQVVGAAHVGFADVQALASHFADGPQTPQEQIIYDIRLPRTLVGLFVGVHFALAGMIMQIVLRNPLAEPGILGISSGASLAVVISILGADFIWGDVNSRAIAGFPPELVPLFALLGGLVAAILVLWFSWNNGLQPQRTAIAGVILGIFLNALVLAVIVGIGAGRAQMAILWISGSLFSRGYENLQPIIPWTVLGLFATILIARPLSILRFSDDFARNAGLNPSLWRVACAVVAIGLAASAVSVAGPIGFVGLVIPHLARLLVGANIGAQLTVAALAGACFTTGADLLGRAVIAPLEIPVGAITSLVGVPIFILILQRNLWRLK